MCVYFSPAAWHYGWTGGRYKQDTVHVLEVALFAPQGGVGAAGRRTAEEVLHCVSLVRSSEFKVYSSRRANPADKVRRRMVSQLKRFSNKEHSGAQPSTYPPTASP